VNLLLLNIPKELAAGIKTSLSSVGIKLHIVIDNTINPLLTQFLENKEYDLVFYFVNQSAPDVKGLIDARLNAIGRAAIVLVLPQSFKQLTAEYLSTGALAIVQEKEVGEFLFLEKVIPVYHSLLRQLSEEKQDVLIYISKAIQYFSHEIKNPLTNIDLSSSELKIEIDPSNKLANKFLYFIEKNCQRINDVLTDSVALLEIKERSITQFDIRKLFIELGSHFEHQLLDKIITYKSQASIGQIMADKPFLMQLLGQLIKNSIEACPVQGGLIEITGSTKNKEIIICIQDNGRGITTEHLPFVFNPFYSISSRSRGLGLSIAADLVKRQGGVISLESDPGVKTCVFISIPILN